MNSTLVVRVPLYDSTNTKPFVERLKDLCNVELAAGYRLASTFMLGPDMLIAVFQELPAAS